MPFSYLAQPNSCSVTSFPTRNPLPPRSSQPSWPPPQQTRHGPPQPWSRGMTARWAQSPWRRSRKKMATSPMRVLSKLKLGRSVDFPIWASIWLQSLIFVACSCYFSVQPQEITWIGAAWLVRDKCFASISCRRSDLLHWKAWTLAGGSMVALRVLVFFFFHFITFVHIALFISIHNHVHIHLLFVCT